jgi:nucleotide-binding universal stress UspA family protein
MILVTCTIASFMAQKGAKNIALLEASGNESEEPVSLEKVLVAVNSPGTAEELVNLALTVKSKSNKSGLMALTVIDQQDSEARAVKQAKQTLDQAAKTAAAADNHLHELLRFDVNTVNGIVNVIKEHKITDLILGLTDTKGISDNFLGNLTEGILAKSNSTTLIYKPSQPLATIKRHLVIVPDRAEKEIGFPFWLIKVWNIARNTGSKLVIYGSKSTLRYIKEVHFKHPVESEFIEFSDWSDFLILSRDIKTDDNLILVLSRKERPSFNNIMTKIPSYLNKYFQSTNFILIFPIQAGDHGAPSVDLKNPSVLEPLETLDDLGNTISKLFKKR